jgi:hypothetical protein
MLFLNEEVILSNPKYLSIKLLLVKKLLENKRNNFLLILPGKLV